MSAEPNNFLKGLREVTTKEPKLLAVEILHHPIPLEEYFSISKRDLCQLSKIARKRDMFGLAFGCLFGIISTGLSSLATATFTNLMVEAIFIVTSVISVFLLFGLGYFWRLNYKDEANIKDRYSIPDP